MGMRELRDSLSKQITAVRAGETITVTDHGKPVACIVPIGTSTTFEQLVASGEIRPAKRPKEPAGDPILSGVHVSDLIGAQRR